MFRLTLWVHQTYLEMADDLATDGTVETDAGYFASSTSSAIEINNNSIGLVSGTSGRQIHALFNSQSLVNAGDILEALVRQLQTPILQAYLVFILS